MATKTYKAVNPIVTLLTQGTTIADGGFSAISSTLTATLPSGGHENMAMADIEIYIPGLSVAPGSTPYIELHMQPYSLDGVNAGPEPDSTLARIIRTMRIKPVTTAQYIIIESVPIIGVAAYKVKAVVGGASNTVLAGLTIKVEPWKLT